MKIHRAAILGLYDKRRKWPAETGSPVCAITGIIGEDLQEENFNTVETGQD